ncbi:MAG: hypothetical protein ACI85I_001796 [Arenicella sp.]|jgi:hypothetical protein
MRNYLLLLLFFATIGNAMAQDSLMLKYANEVKAQDLKKHLEIIASDEYEGRETGQKGQKMAAEYIANHFKALGLQGPVKSNEKNPFYQTFNLEKSMLDSFNVTTKAGESLKIFKDFFPYGKFEIQQELDVVFVGYGIETDSSYSDYKDLDVAGKAVVILEGEPEDKHGKSLLTEEQKGMASNGAKIKLANEKGATLVILVYKTAEKFKKKNKYFEHASKEGTLGFPSKEVSKKSGLICTFPHKASMILGIKSSDLTKAIHKGKKKGKSIAGEFESKITINSAVKTTLIPTENVLGYLEGTDKKEELLVLTAHYDHIGIIDGKVYNGADDDGSGTVAVLEMAESFVLAAKNGNRPRRSILFMAVTGEEKGLLGSEYYSENPIFPLENTVTNLNTDMIGREDKKHKGNPNYVYLIGSDMLSQDLHNLSETIGKKHFPKLELDYKFNKASDPNRYYYRSDHYNFAKHNIPVIFYFNGVHEDYHKHTDTVDKIDFDKIQNITRLTFATAWVIANREQRLELDKVEE